MKHWYICFYNYKMYNIINLDGILIRNYRNFRTLTKSGRFIGDQFGIFCYVSKLSKIMKYNLHEPQILPAVIFSKYGITINCFWYTNFNRLNFLGILKFFCNASKWPLSSNWYAWKYDLWFDSSTKKTTIHLNYHWFFISRVLKLYPNLHQIVFYAIFAVVYRLKLYA